MIDMCDCEKQTTEEMLALKGIKLSPKWLREVSKMLGLFKGSGDMVVHWRPKSQVPRTEWTVLQEMSPSQD